jgi:hypothetical protein
VVQCTKSDPAELVQQDHKYLESTSAESKERVAAAKAVATAKETSTQTSKTVTVQEPVTTNHNNKQTIATTSADSTADQQIKPQQPQQSSMETFRPAPSAANNRASATSDVQLQQEHIQYVDNECCQVAVGPNNAGGGVQQQHYNEAQTLDLGPQQQQQQQQPQGGNSPMLSKYLGRLLTYVSTSCL